MSKPLHLNIVVDDIEVATEFYCTVLGFEQSANADGPMDYPDVALASFARDAGFATKLVPDAVAVHLRGKGEQSPELRPLQTYNKWRLYRRRHGR